MKVYLAYKAIGGYEGTYKEMIEVFSKRADAEKYLKEITDKPSDRVIRERELK